MNPLIAAAMAACLNHMSGGTYEKDFVDCDKITVEYNMEVESLTQTPATISQFHEERSRQDDAAVVARAGAILPN
jgi:phosphoribosylcarboxyaminoimidazole (NCAIR) mutase